MNTAITPMACLQARLDYAHHVSKKANRKGSHADDEAICIAQDAFTRSELAKAVREMDKNRFDSGYNHKTLQAVLEVIEQ